MRTLFGAYRLVWSAHRRWMTAGMLACACLCALSGCAIRLGTLITTPTPAGPGISIPVKVERGPNGSTLVLASVTIDNRGPYTFAVDTGASTSLIDRKLAQQLGLKQAGAPQPIAGISSNEEAIPVRVTQWNTGKITLPSAVIASASLFQSQHDQELQGLLGSDIWSQFGKITIDYADGTLTVYQQVAAFGGAVAYSADALTQRSRQVHAPLAA